MDYLGKCVICGNMGDTGCLIPFNDNDREKGTFFICLDCSDNTPVTELKQIIKEKQKEFAESEMKGE